MGTQVVTPSIYRTTAGQSSALRKHNDVDGGNVPHGELTAGLVVLQANAVVVHGYELSDVAISIVSTNNNVVSDAGKYGRLDPYLTPKEKNRFHHVCSDFHGVPVCLGEGEIEFVDAALGVTDFAIDLLPLKRPDLRNTGVPRGNLRLFREFSHHVLIDLEEVGNPAKEALSRRRPGEPGIKCLLAEAKFPRRLPLRKLAAVKFVSEHLRQPSPLSGLGGLLHRLFTQSFCHRFGPYHLDKFVTMTYKPRTMPTDLTNLLTLVNGNEEEDMMRYLGFALLALPFVTLAVVITLVSGLSVMLSVFGIAAAIVVVVMAGAYLAFEY